MKEEDAVTVATRLMYPEALITDKISNYLRTGCLRQVMTSVTDVMAFYVFSRLSDLVNYDCNAPYFRLECAFL